MSNLESIKLYSLTATSSVLLLVYSVTLYRVYKGSRFKLVIKLIVLLMGYNIGFMAHQWILKWFWSVVNETINNGPCDTTTLIELLTPYFFAVILELGCFNVSHWMFAFQYY